MINEAFIFTLINVFAVVRPVESNGPLKPTERRSPNSLDYRNALELAKAQYNPKSLRHNAAD